MIQKTLTSFDLKQIADSGQCFRMLPAEEANTYTVISGPHFLKAAQDGQTWTVSFEPEDRANSFADAIFELKDGCSAWLRSMTGRLPMRGE